MSGETSDRIRITLNGDWSMNGVTRQLPHLVEHLATLPDSLSSKDRQASGAEIQSEVVMAGIDELDASGCQLLTLYILLLKQKGVMPLLTDIPDAIKEKIQYLGFGRELGTHFETPQGCV